MAELFSVTGQSEDVAVTVPNLQGSFIPAIDKPQMEDGFGFTIPFCGGSTARSYLDYGLSSETSSYNTLLKDLAGSLFPSIGGNITYNLEGLVGPQGIPGPAGIQGLPGIGASFYAPPSGLFALSSSLQQIDALGTKPDQMIYTYAMTYYYTGTNKTPSEQGASPWYGLDTDSGGSKAVLAENGDEIYFTTDYGDNWSTITPLVTVNKNWYDVNGDSDLSNLIACENAGRVYISDDSGSSWSEVQPAGDVNNKWSDVASDSDGSVLMAGANTGGTGRLYVSTNSGVDWSEVRPAGDTNCNWEALVCGSSGAFMVAGNNGERIYTSSDYGQNWVEAPSPAGGSSRNWIDTDCSDDGNTIAAVCQNTAVYVSTDGGDSWAQRLPGSSSVFMSVTVSGQGSTIIAGTNGYSYVSFDFGASWAAITDVGTDENPQQNWKRVVLNYNGDIAYLASYISNGRVYSSIGNGVPVWAETTITAFTRTFLDDTTSAEARTTLDAQQQGDVLDDLNTLGANSADSEFLVGTGAGTLAWESGATVRASLGLTIGTDVQAYDAGLSSLAGLTYASASFVKMTGADIFALRTIGETADDLEGTIDHNSLANYAANQHVALPNTIANVLSDHNLAAHTTLGLFDQHSDVDHDQTTNYVANKHIDHTGVTLTAGVALSGGGDISASRTFNLDITELVADAAPDGAADYVVTYDANAAAHKKVLLDNLPGGGADEKVKIDAAATADYIGAANNDGVLRTGTGISYADGGNFVTLDLDINALTVDASPIGSTDYVATYDADAGVEKKVLLNNFHRFVDRGDPAAWDYDHTTLTTDGNYYDLDLSGIVPAGAVAVKMVGYLLDDVAGSFLQFRKNGNANAINRPGVATQVVNTTFYFDCIVACDSNRVIEYRGSNVTFSSIGLAVAGWWLA